MVCISIVFVTVSTVALYGTRFGEGHKSQPIEWDYFYCSGTERNLTECRRSLGRVCDHSQDASVICS